MILAKRFGCSFCNVRVAIATYIRVYVPFEDLDYIALVSVHSHQLLPGHHYLGSHSESLQYMDIEKYSVISCKANTKLHTHDKNNLHLR